MMATQVEKWDFFELTLQAQSSGNPFLEVSLELVFLLQQRQFRGFMTARTSTKRV